MKFLVMFFLILAGCASAELVEKRFEPKRGGVVKYAEGIGENSGANKAGLIMTEFCQPLKAKILVEKKVDEISSYQSNGSETTPVTKPFTYAEFYCQ